MPTIVSVQKLEQLQPPDVDIPANVLPRADGQPPHFVAWRAAFTDDTGFVHFATLRYGLCETQTVENVSTALLDDDGNVVTDENGEAVFVTSQQVMPHNNPAAAALLAQGLVDEAVAADIARVKAALEDPNNPVGSVP